MEFYIWSFSWQIFSFIEREHLLLKMRCHEFKLQKYSILSLNLLYHKFLSPILTYDSCWGRAVLATWINNNKILLTFCRFTWASLEHPSVIQIKLQFCIALQHQARYSQNENLAFILPPDRCILLQPITLKYESDIQFELLGAKNGQ